VALSLAQKAALFRHSQGPGSELSQKELAIWAKVQFNLDKEPGQGNISAILKMGKEKLFEKITSLPNPQRT